MSEREFRSGLVVPVGIVLLVLVGVLAGVRISQGRDVPVAAANPAATRYLDLSIAYDREKRFAESVAAARQAIRLKPDFQLAKNNLAWAVAEQARAEKAK